MQLRELVEQVKQDVQGFDVYEILAKAEIVLRELAKDEWSFLTARLDPGVKTSTGLRFYPLPDNFGANFVRGADDGTQYVCKLSDGTGEQHLNYLSPAQFFDGDFTAATNGTPTDYTIQTDPAFFKQIWLDPPPDSNNSSDYTIRGLYKPTFIDLTLDSFAPEEVSSYLLNGTMMKLDPENSIFARDFVRASNALILEEARMRNTRLVDQRGELPGQDGWTPEFF